MSDSTGLRTYYDAELADNLLPLDGGGGNAALRHPWVVGLGCAARGHLEIEFLVPAASADDVRFALRGNYLSNDVASADIRHRLVGWPFVHPSAWREGDIVLGGAAWACWHDEGDYAEPFYVRLQELSLLSESSQEEGGRIRMRAAVKGEPVPASACFSRLEVDLDVGEDALPPHQDAVDETSFSGGPSSVATHGHAPAAAPGPGSGPGRALFDWAIDTPEGDIKINWKPANPVLWHSPNLVTVSCVGCYAGARIQYKLKASFDTFTLKSLEASAKVTPAARFVITTVLGAQYSASKKVTVIPTTRLFSINSESRLTGCARSPAAHMLPRKGRGWPGIAFAFDKFDAYSCLPSTAGALLIASLIFAVPLGFVDLAIPLYATLTVDMNLAVLARIAVQNVGLEVGYTIALAAKYSPDQGFRTAYAGAPHLVIPPPVVDLSGSLSAYASVTLNVSTNVFNSWPMSFIAKPYLDFKASMKSSKCASQQDIYAEAYYGVEGSVFVDKVRLRLRHCVRASHFAAHATVPRLHISLLTQAPRPRPYIQCFTFHSATCPPITISV